MFEPGLIQPTQVLYTRDLAFTYSDFPNLELLNLEFSEPRGLSFGQAKAGGSCPADKLAGGEAETCAARDRKLAEARQRRKQQREAARSRAVA